MIKNKKGFGLVELSIALALAAIVGILVFRSYSESTENRKITEQINQIGMVRTAVDSMFGAKRNYNTLSPEILNPSLPKSMLFDMGYAQAIIGSASLMSAAGIDYGGVVYNDAWYLYMIAVQDTVCRKIVTKDFGREMKSINVSQSIAHSDIIAGKSRPYTPEEANEACHFEKDGDPAIGANYITIVFQ